jgi:hypothetical protein
MKPQCFASYDTLMRAVFSCGPSKVTVDLSWTHSEYVSFPTNWAPGNPSSLDVVKCIQREVGCTHPVRTAAKGGSLPDLASYLPRKASMPS